jgi:hypothetical protein
VNVHAFAVPVSVLLSALSVLNTEVPDGDSTVPDQFVPVTVQVAAVPPQVAELKASSHDPVRTLVRAVVVTAVVADVLLTDPKHAVPTLSKAREPRRTHTMMLVRDAPAFPPVIVVSVPSETLAKVDSVFPPFVTTEPTCVNPPVVIVGVTADPALQESATTIRSPDARPESAVALADVVPVPPTSVPTRVTAMADSYDNVPSGVPEDQFAPVVSAAILKLSPLASVIEEP